MGQSKLIFCFDGVRANDFALTGNLANGVSVKIAQAFARSKSLANFSER
jgi:hypothetical protein